MPKRKGFLYPEIYDWNNLLTAYKKARLSKGHKQEVMDFEYDLENILIEIQEKLKNNEYDFSGYKYFKIYEPKERNICCAPFQDRVIHHAICNVLNPILDRSIIAASYACRKGKGLHRAIKRAFYFYRNSEFVYKFDIRKYFYTIDHQILLSKIKKKIKDPHLISLLEKLLETHSSGGEYYFPFEGDTIFDYGRSRGLPIGNLTSQIFANYYLSEIDHFIKEKLHCKYYLRYMDDAIIFSDHKIELKKNKEILKNELSKLRLLIHPDKNQIHPTKRGLNFLGFRFYENQIKIQNKNLVRFKRKLKKHTQDKKDVSEMLLSLNGHLGFLFAGQTKKIIERVFDELTFQDFMKSYKFTLKRV